MLVNVNYITKKNMGILKDSFVLFYFLVMDGTEIKIINTDLQSKFILHLSQVQLKNYIRINFY